MNLKIIIVNAALVVCIAVAGVSFSDTGIQAFQKVDTAANVMGTCTAQNSVYANTALSTSMS